MNSPVRNASYKTGKAARLNFALSGTYLKTKVMSFNTEYWRRKLSGIPFSVGAFSHVTHLRMPYYLSGLDFFLPFFTFSFPPSPSLSLSFCFAITPLCFRGDLSYPKSNCAYNRLLTYLVFALLLILYLYKIKF